MKYLRLYCLIIFCLSLIHSSAQSFDESNASPNFQSEKIVRMQEMLEVYASYGRLSGNILFTHHGQTILEKSFGLASLQSDVPNTINTSFDIGSVSKQFTAAAILKLVEEKKIHLHQPINNYLGNYSSKKWKKVTPHHLLTHTSGIPSLYQSGQGLEMLLPEAQEIEMSSLISFFKDKKLLSKPGKEYRYSNSGYILLAAIIEEACGISYSQYLEETFFKPLDMKETYWPTSAPHDGAKGHLGFHQNTKPAEKWSASWAIGAGGWFSSVNDLEKWRKHIHSTSFLNSELREAYTNPHITNRKGHYAYGWEISTHKGQQIVLHDGATLGFVSQFIQVPEEEIGIYVLLNQTHDLELLGTTESFARDIALNLSDLYHGEDISTIPSRIQLPSHELTRMNGTYTFDEGEEWKIESRGKNLFVTSKEHSPIQLPYYHDLPDTSVVLKRSYAIAKALQDNKIGKMAKHCDPMMKILTWAGIMKLGYKSIIGDRKYMKDFHVYKVEPLENKKQRITFRTIFEEDQIDFHLYFNEKGKLQGIFDSGYFTPGPKEISIVPISNHEFMMDGFPFGEKDIVISFKEGGLELEENIFAKRK